MRRARTADGARELREIGESRAGDLPDRVPAYPKLFVATFEALRDLGGSASNEEILEKVVENLNLSPRVIEMSHGETGKSELEYRLAWARTYLRIAGLVVNSRRGVWAFTPEGANTASIDGKDVVRLVRERTQRGQNGSRRRGGPRVERHLGPSDGAKEEASPPWRTTLHSVLLALDPAKFERLCQRLMRESGFTQVEVTGRSGDGGIDGHGIVRVAGLLSFPVLFQCKRWKGTVPPSTIRDFRGAMVGRADKGLILTTGTFSLEARREATRDGAPPIDLVDGEQLMDKLRELSLGVSTKLVRVSEVDAAWFDGL